MTKACHLVSMPQMFRLIAEVERQKGHDNKNRGINEVCRKYINSEWLTNTIVIQITGCTNVKYYSHGMPD